MKTTQLHKTLGLLSLVAMLLVPYWSEANNGISNALDAEAYLSASVHVEDMVTAETSVYAETETEAKSNLESHSTTSVEMEQENKHDYLRNSEGVTVLSASEVYTETDLVIFGRNLAAKEEVVSDIRFHIAKPEESEVAVAYQHEGRLFGFIPVNVTSKLVVKRDATGSVQVRTERPWHQFLVVANPTLRAEVENRVKNNLVIENYASAEASFQTHARIAEAVIADVKAEISAAAVVKEGD